MTTQDPSVRLVTEESLTSGPGKEILDDKYVTATVTGDPADPDVSFFLDGVEL